MCGIKNNIFTLCSKTAGIIFFASFLIFISAGRVDAKPANNIKKHANRVDTNKPVHVTEIKYWSNPTYTRVVINLTGETVYESRLLKEDPSIEKPRRLYIDFKNAVLSPNIKEVPINDGLLRMARAGQYSKDIVRVVLDIESIDDYKIFPMEGPFRVVVDVKGHQKKAAETTISPVPLLDKVKKQTSQKTGRIVIDAGHGGHDPGAIGKKGLQEKDVALRIVKLLKSSIENELGADVVLTRGDDTFIPLEERTAIANTKNADIFVSVHVNASFNKEASGVETYYLDLTDDATAMRVAARENAVSTKKMSDLQYILNDLMKTAKHNESSVLASNIQESLVSSLRKKYSDVKGNGVKGAPFYVLVGTHMPSVLVEVSFISNIREEARLRDENYIREIVNGITSGIKGYLKETETAE